MAVTYADHPGRNRRQRRRGAILRQQPRRRGRGRGALARSILRLSACAPTADRASRRPPESRRPAPCEAPAPGRNRPARLRAALSRAAAPARHAAAACLVVVAGLLAVSAAAQAQTVTTLVSNTDSQHDGGSTGNVRAQSFETGFNTAGYTISEVRIRFGSAFGRTTLVKIRADAGGEPGDLVATLTNPGTLSSNRFNTFTASPGTTLDASTTYWISVNEEVAAAQRVFISRTTSNAETGQTGWSIGDSHLLRTSETSSWGSDNHSLFIAIRGTPIVDPNDMTAPALDPNTPPSVDGPTLTLTYDEILDRTSTPAPGDFTVTVAGAPRTVSSVSVGTYTVTLTLASVVLAGQSVVVSYAVPASNPVQDIAGNAAEALADHSVVNNTTITVTGVAVTSVPVTAPDDYGTGETIEITVTFSEPVTVGHHRGDAVPGADNRQRDPSGGLCLHGCDRHGPDLLLRSDRNGPRPGRHRRARQCARPQRRHDPQRCRPRRNPRSFRAGAPRAATRSTRSR